MCLCVCVCPFPFSPTSSLLWISCGFFFVFTVKSRTGVSISCLISCYGKPARVDGKRMFCCQWSILKVREIAYHNNAIPTRKARPTPRTTIWQRNTLASKLQIGIWNKWSIQTWCAGVGEEKGKVPNLLALICTCNGLRCKHKSQLLFPARASSNKYSISAGTSRVFRVAVCGFKQTILRS